MTKFGQGDGRASRPGAFSGQSSPGRPTDPEREERISVKDNRRIDPKTGTVRQVAEGGSGPAGGPAAAGADDVIPAGSAETAGEGGGLADALAAAQEQAAERTADLQRITAEYANYRKRADRDKQAAAVAGKATVMSELLSVLDDLDRAEEHGDLTGGFKNVADKLTGILQRAGLEHYGAPGDEFDPVIHEAVQFATSADVDHPTVTTVLRLGYLFDERVLRPAVVVVTGPEHEADDAGGAAAAPDSDAPGGDAGAGDSGAADGAADGAAPGRDEAAE